MLAYFGFGVWSLVYQSITFTLINAVLLWTFSSWRPKFIFSKVAIMDIFKFSINLTGFNIANYFSRNMDYLLIGKFLGAEALGFYSLAYKLMMIPIQNISWVIGRVMFPAYSRIQNDLKKLSEAYLKTVQVVSLITFPMIFGFFAVATEFIIVLFGLKWEPSIPIIRIFCICGALQSIGTLSGSIYQSLNETKTQFRLQLMGTLIVTIAIVVGLKFGIQGVAFFYTLQYLIWFNINLYFVLKLLHLKSGDFYSKLKIPFVINIIMVLILLLIKPLFFVFQQSLVLVSLIIIAAIVYFFMLIITKEIVLKNKKIIWDFLK
jgi:PST family polysaccharide transporter